MKSRIVTAGVEDREHKAVESEQMLPHLASAPSLGEIRQRAYELHLERGCVHG